MADGYVQSAVTSVIYPDASTTISATFSSPVTAGGLVVGSCTSDLAVSSVTDDKSNTYTIIRQLTDGANVQLATFYAKNINNAPTTITVTYVGSAIYRGLIIEEASGLDPSSPLDQETAQTQSNPGGGADAITSGNVTTGFDGEFIYSACTRTQGIAGDTVDAGTGFTRRQTTAGGIAIELYVEDLVQSLAGSIAGTWTPSVDGRFSTQVATFKTPSTATSRLLASLGAGQ